MKKTLLLIGALAILSTTAMGVTEQWVTDEITAGLEVNNIIRDIEREEEKKEITKNKEDIASLGRLTSETHRNHNDAASGMKESVEKHLGEFEHSVASNGTTNGAVAGKVQAEAFDVVAGAVGENKNTIADLSSVVMSKASVSDVNAAKDKANSAMSIAIENTGKINNATDGMIASAGKLGITVETVEANSKYLEAGKVQAEIFDKTVDVIAKNKDDIKGIDGKAESNGQLIAGNKQRVDAVNTRINAAEGAIGKTNTKIEENTLAINTRINETDSRIDSNSERINTAEGAIGKTNAKIEENTLAINTRINETDSRVDSNSERINTAEGAIGKTNAKIEENTLAINTRINETDSRVDSNSERINTAEGKIIKSNLAIKENNNAIEKNTQDLASHKSEALARDEKIEVAISDLKVTDGKVNTAIEDLKKTDEKVDVAILSLKEKDKQLEAVDKAIYEVVGNTRDENATPIKENKIDKNRDDIVINKGNIKINEDDIKINGEQIQQTQKLADHNSEYIEKNSKRITGLEKKVDGLESKMNKGLAMAAATSSIVYPHLGKGDLGIGAGMGGYGSTQAIAIGVAMQPTENVRINTNVSTSDTSDTMYGAGVGYKFNIFGS